MLENVCSKSKSIKVNYDADTINNEKHLHLIDIFIKIHSFNHM